jgi:hypothetical protein
LKELPATDGREHSHRRGDLTGDGLRHAGLFRRGEALRWG